jgi:formylglycine-generating enzyme required for sulfatase activity
MRPAPRVVRGALRAAAALLGASSSSACAPPAATADMFAAFGFDGAAATVRVAADDGEAAVFDVRLPDGELRRARGSAALACLPTGDGGSACSASLVLAPGDYRFALDVEAVDRCGARAVVVTLGSGPTPVSLDRFDNRTIELTTLERGDRDDDGDGIVNALEPVVCGRFDEPDGAVPPAHCQSDDDPCCVGVDGLGFSSLQGQLARFDGGPHRRADGTTIDVPAFGLDATETTWGTFARCVAAGACLPGQAAHALRRRLTDRALDLREPVVGLGPLEAAEVCAWRGGRLPDDDEWDFAAAHRPPPDGAAAVRARYPFDAADGDAAALDVDVGCVEGEAGVAANHAAHGRACPSGPVPVGSYPSTFARRGAGSPVADLAGNAAEWTVRRGPVAVAVVGVPEDVVEVAVRGGAAGGIVELLENDLALRVAVDAVDAEEQIADLAARAGVRCAFDVALVPPAPLQEPACVAPEEP